jgi:N-acetylglutamate synthase-like GNAT family acetyltransferase
MLNLRYEILRKPLGLQFDAKELDEEKDAILIAAFEDEVMLGCCFLTRINNDTVRLRQVAVQNNLQGKGIGATILNFAENIARDRRYKTIITQARKSTAYFFEKHGYKVDGEEFIHLTIPHCFMKKKLI